MSVIAWLGCHVDPRALAELVIILASRTMCPKLRTQQTAPTMSKIVFFDRPGEPPRALVRGMVSFTPPLNSSSQRRYGGGLRSVREE